MSQLDIKVRIKVRKKNKSEKVGLKMIFVKRKLYLYV